MVLRRHPEPARWRRCALAAVSLVVVLGSRAAVAEPMDAETTWRLASEGRFLELLAAAAPPPIPPEDCATDRAYLLGLALLRVHRFDEARRLQDFESAMPIASGRSGEVVRASVLQVLGLAPSPRAEGAPEPR
jgi:hypothetical protein